MPSDTIHLGLLEQSAIREMANIGLGHATTALASMTGKSFNMSVPDAEEIPLEEIPYRLGGDEHVTVGIYMPIEGDTQGHIAFLMSWPGAQCLWNMLLGMSPQLPTEVDELAASAMLEIGNIINGSFLSAISDMTNLSLEATPPSMCVDMCEAVLSSIVTEASRSDHSALAVRTVITDESGGVDGFFVFIPTVGGLRKLFTALGIPEAA